MRCNIGVTSGVTCFRQMLHLKTLIISVLTSNVTVTSYFQEKIKKNTKKNIFYPTVTCYTCFFSYNLNNQQCKV